MSRALSVVLMTACSGPATPVVVPPGASMAAPSPRVAPDQVWRVAPPAGHSQRFDPSGLARHQGELVTISDKAALPDLYALRPGEAGWMRSEPLGRWEGHPEAGTDTEGLAVCGKVLWMVVERHNQLIRLPSNARGSVLQLDLQTPAGSSIPHPRLWGNAGLEGVACAPDGRLWVAKEREPRAIFQVDQSTGATTSVWDTRARTDQAIHRGSRAVWPAWADLQFVDGHLYAMHRDERAIIRLSPDTGEETGRMNLELDERQWYADAEPWGMAEGMLIEDDHVMVMLDNNDTLLHAEPGAGHPVPLLLRYPRPSGF